MLRGGQRKEGSLQIQRPEETLNGNGNSWAVTPQKKADNTNLGKTGVPRLMPQTPIYRSLRSEILQGGSSGRVWTLARFLYRNRDSCYRELREVTHKKDLA